MAQIAVEGILGVDDAADTGADRARPGAGRDQVLDASSVASSSLWPPGPKILMPLSGIGLCDAEIITPKSAS